MTGVLKFKVPHIVLRLMRVHVYKQLKYFTKLVLDMFVFSTCYDIGFVLLVHLPDDLVLN